MGIVSDSCCFYKALCLLISIQRNSILAMIRCQFCNLLVFKLQIMQHAISIYFKFAMKANLLFVLCRDAELHGHEKWGECRWTAKILHQHAQPCGDRQPLAEPIAPSLDQFWRSPEQHNPYRSQLCLPNAEPSRSGIEPDRRRCQRKNGSRSSTRERSALFLHRQCQLSWWMPSPVEWPQRHHTTPRFERGRHERRSSRNGNWGCLTTETRTTRHDVQSLLSML